MRRYLLPLIVVGILLAPSVVSAADWFPIVPCGAAGDPACTSCDLFKAFKNVIDLVLYGITGPIAAFMIVWAGGMMLISGGNATRFAEGRKLLWNTLIGVTIILMAWLFTNTLIKTLATGSASDNWFEFSCPDFLQQPEADALPAPVPEQGSPEKPAPELAQASAAVCDPANLATANRVPNNTRLNAPSLNALIACINRDPIVSALYDRNQLFTFENKNPLCNLTHGVEGLCGVCEHTKYSCHYGGSTGSQGAMAVDYNWNQRPVTYLIASRTIVTNPTSTSSPCNVPGTCRTVTGEQGLFDEVYRSIVRNDCAFKFIQFEPGSSGGHTHVDTADCPSGGAGVKGRRAPPIQ